jgi:hypothetical protein
VVGGGPIYPFDWLHCHHEEKREKKMVSGRIARSGTVIPISSKFAFGEAFAEIVYFDSVISKSAKITAEWEE